MAKQLTVRGVPDETSRRLEALSRERGTSVNATVLEVLNHAVGVDERRRALERHVTWTDCEAREFDAALAEQRAIDDGLWD